jgi:glycosyltransferase involved in cell wall biosynthesis
VRVLLWHGYLLRGTGSNIYKANIVRAWRAAGHDVLLMCQEREMEDLHFVDAYGDFSPQNDRFEITETGVNAAAGSVHIVRPSIGELLPVYVVDHYDGFRVKQYLELTRSELADYVAQNVDALTTAIKKFEPRAIVAGHEVMGPFIAREAQERTGAMYAAQLHGSALEYVVKQSAEYLDYATRGLGGAHAVIGGSEYMVREASSVIPGWSDRAHIVNPGCDVELFRPAVSRSTAQPNVGYVGKFIPQKGVHNLLAALGLTSAPGLRAVIIGYGSLDEPLSHLWQCLQTGDQAGIEGFAQSHGVTSGALKELVANGEMDGGYRTRASAIEVKFTGRLEHGPLSHVLPTLDVLVVPSIMAEAFGMVAAEAAAAGVLPIVPNHSGIGEVGSILESALDMPGLLTFDSADPIRGIAEAIDRILSIDPGSRREMGHAIAALAHDRWAWPTVARALLEAATPQTE